MAILATQTLVGSVGRVYDLRTVGKDNLEVIDFSLAMTPRKKVNDEWVDGETYWINVTAWGKLAKNISESFNPGDRVFVIGRTDMKSGYTNKEGVEVAAKPILVAEFAGLEVSYNAAHSDRPARGERSSESRSSSSSERTAPKKEARPKVDEDVIDFDDDDDLEFETPF